MRSYGEFCPVSKAAEVLAERWTPLIVRELLMGSRRFNQLEAGLPRIPRSLLVQRLRSLERAGVIQRRPGPRRAVEYHLTPAGRDLYDVIISLGDWGLRWVLGDIGPQHVNPRQLIWDMHRRLHLDRLPPRRVVVQFDFRGASQQSIWLVLDPAESSVCLDPPGFEVDLLVTADTVALHQIWMGKLSFADALRRDLVELDGPSDLVRAFPGWLALSVFAEPPPSSGAFPLPS